MSQIVRNISAFSLAVLFKATLTNKIVIDPFKRIRSLILPLQINLAIISPSRFAPCRFDRSGAILSYPVSFDLDESNPGRFARPPQSPQTPFRSHIPFPLDGSLRSLSLFPHTPITLIFILTLLKSPILIHHVPFLYMLFF